MKKEREITMQRTFDELIDVPKLQQLMDFQYAATGIPIGIIGVDGTIHVATGWQEICTQFHRVHPKTACLCRESDNYITAHLHDGGPVEYRCKNGLWDIGVPILIRQTHMATLFVGQFHYEGEIPDRGYFSKQADRYGFDKERYLAALERLPVVSRSKIKSIMAYYLQFVDYLIEIGLTRLQKEKTTETLARANQDLERFAYIAAHDLKEPLRKVGSYMELVADRYGDRLDNDAREFIEYAVNGAQQMKDMVDDLLYYSRIGAKDLPFSSVDITKVLDRVLLELKPVIEKNNAMITFDHLPVVIAEESQMAHLFRNIIDNAVKFRKDVPPRIHISCQRQQTTWRFDVKDNGIGIDSRFFGQIFQIFKRLHTIGTYNGTGIGLAVCKKIVERHGGDIAVESTPGRGSVFYFTIPQFQ